MSYLREFSNGEKLPAIGLGTMGLAAFYGKPTSQEGVNKLLDAAVENNVVLLDSAQAYSVPGTLGDNERQIGSWLRSSGKRDKVFISTKFIMRYKSDGTAGMDGSREWCHEACQNSLEWLGVDQIDLFYVHRPDPNVPVEETVAALKELKDAGKIRYIGVSEFTVEQLERASQIAHIDAYQVELSPWTPEILTNGLLEWCEKSRFKTPDDLEADDWRKNHPRFQGENFYKNLELVKEIEKLAHKKGVKASQICLAWVLSKSPSIFVIPGTTSPERLKENAAARDVVLSKEEIAEIDEVINSFKVQGTRYPDGAPAAF
ncbi:hypothetical protein OC846_003656 [Tilletia horrida]|uniref:NADP-dependent oxidoreductase domain-containing protein n=1 Tax=Tilletia horrida TaxID=155126 RepID=A0AAN6JXS6_9BASI|nr:hypothetical protein OC845_004296 [Tilletia horrida]KAK0550459.1 hypothetical protein OC846_003656 [Tilletia horrida]KAK0564109.1 hypothetical protein OC861_004460 [Tilletia horrida]